jgi:VIT1/CCC1 family predicted Fe2+/Mn2+ transporter
MNISSAEKSLAKYHLLHFVIGAIVAAILLVIPKVAAALLCVVVLAMFLPSVLNTLVVADFTNKWFDRGATLLGGVGVALLFHFLGKL